MKTQMMTLQNCSSTKAAMEAIQICKLKVDAEDTTVMR